VGAVNILLRNACWEGAYYLGGYAAECALKACICKRTRRYDFPDKETAIAVHTHHVDTLLSRAGLDEDLKEARKILPKFSENWG